MVEQPKMKIFLQFIFLPMFAFKDKVEGCASKSEKKLDLSNKNNMLETVLKSPSRFVDVVADRNLFPA